MSNLVREQRVDRNGKLVTRHVRALAHHVASALMPKVSLETPYMRTVQSANTENLGLLQERMDNLFASILADGNARKDDHVRDLYSKLDAPANAGDQRIRVALMAELVRATNEFERLEKRVEAARSSFDDLSPETVEVLLFSFSSDDDNHPNELLSVLELEEELDKREIAMYRDLLRGAKWWGEPKDILPSIRSSLSMEDLTTVDPHTAEHRTIRNVIEVASHIKSLRFEEISSQASSKNQRDLHEAARRVPAMTPALAEVITDYPDKTEMVKHFMAERVSDFIVENVDSSALREYLSAPTQSLSSGVL